MGVTLVVVLISLVTQAASTGAPKYTWSSKQVGPLPGIVGTLTGIAANSNGLLCGIDSAGQLFSSSNEGATWTRTFQISSLRTANQDERNQITWDGKSQFVIFPTGNYNSYLDIWTSADCKNATKKGSQIIPTYHTPKIVGGQGSVAIVNDEYQISIQVCPSSFSALGNCKKLGTDGGYRTWSYLKYNSYRQTWITGNSTTLVEFNTKSIVAEHPIPGHIKLCSKLSLDIEFSSVDTSFLVVGCLSNDGFHGNVTVYYSNDGFKKWTAEATENIPGVVPNSRLSLRAFGGRYHSEKRQVVFGYNVIALDDQTVYDGKAYMYTVGTKTFEEIVPANYPKGASVFWDTSVNVPGKFIVLSGGGDFFYPNTGNTTAARVPLSMSLMQSSREWSTTDLVGPAHLHPLVSVQHNGKQVLWGVDNLYRRSPQSSFCTEGRGDDQCDYVCIIWTSTDGGRTWTWSNKWHPYRVLYASVSPNAPTVIAALVQDRSEADDGYYAYSTVYNAQSPFDELTRVSMFGLSASSELFHSLGIGPNGTLHAGGWPQDYEGPLNWAVSKDGINWKYQALTDDDDYCHSHHLRDTVISGTDKLLFLSSVHTKGCYAKEFSTAGFPVFKEDFHGYAGMTSTSKQLIGYQGYARGVYSSTNGTLWTKLVGFNSVVGKDTKCGVSNAHEFHATFSDPWLIYSLGESYELSQHAFPFKTACAVHKDDFNNPSATHYLLPPLVDGGNVAAVGANQFVVAGEFTYVVQATMGGK